MESTDSREPSYYEVALTNRQVLVAFVVLLTCLLAAFLSGVWVGRGGAPPATAVRPQPAPPAPAQPLEQLSFFAGEAAGERPAAAGERAPAPRPAEPQPEAEPEPARPSVEDAATESMRRTLEAEMAAHREPSAAAGETPAGGAGEPAAPAAEPVEAPAEPAARVADAAQAPAEPQVPEAGTRRRQGAPPDAPPASPPAAATEPAAGQPAADVPAAPSPALAGFWIQVYASTNGARAQEIAGQLRRAGFPVVLAELTRAGAVQHRVRVGPFATRAKAEPSAKRLRDEQRLDTWITDTP